MSKHKSKKDRRNSGRKESINYFPCSLELPEYFEYWDDWGDYRDGIRSNNLGDGSKIIGTYRGVLSPYYCWDANVLKRNKKNKKLAKRRKAFKNILKDSRYTN